MNLQNILAKCDICFCDKYHLQQALTHPSAGKTEFEKYEFLGDRVIGLIVARHLVQHSAQGDSEGSISKISASWTSRETLSQIGEYLELSRYVKVHGAISPKTLNTDGFEALMGAIYLDQTNNDRATDAGLQACTRFWQHVWPMVCPARVGAKTELQEWAHKRNMQPTYSCTRLGGPEHMPKFTAQLHVGDAIAYGTGSAKQHAEADAASRLLRAIKTRVIVWDWAGTLVSATGIREHAETLLRWPATHAILTNASAAKVSAQVHRFGWQNYIAHIQGIEHTYNKPHPRAMLDLLVTLNVKPGPHVLMIGDSDTDIECARAAKCNSFLVQPPEFLSQLKRMDMCKLFS